MQSPNTKNKVSLTILSRPQAIASSGNTKTLLLGSTVFASSRDITIPGYTKLAPRPGAGPLRSLITKEASRLYLGVSDMLMSQASKRGRFALAIDGYLQWGLRSRGKAILIGGFNSETETSLDVLIFENGRFIDYTNKVLPVTTAHHYRETVADLLNEFASLYPEHKLYQAAPLEPFGDSFPKVQYVGDKMFKRLSFRPLSQTDNSRLRRIPLPIGAVALAALFYVCAVGKGWQEYNTAKLAFEAEVADNLLQGRAGVDTAMIDITQQRRFFMNEPRRQIVMTNKSRALVAAIGAIDGLRIHEVTLAGPSPSTNVPTSIGADASSEAPVKTPDVTLRVSVPQRGKSAMEQGREVMEAISTNTGMTARLARQGWNEEGERVVFNIEGFTNG